MLLIVAAVAAVIVLVLGGFVVTRFLNTATDIATDRDSTSETADGSTGNEEGSGNTVAPDGSRIAQVGECIPDQGEAGVFVQNLDFPEVVDCDDPRAVFEVLHVREDPGGTRCIDVHGATDAIWYVGASVEAFCLKKVGDDSSRNINLIRTGECAVSEGNLMYSAECGSPGSYRVLAVYDNPGPLPPVFTGPIEPCVNAGAPEATMVYQWGVADEPGVTEDRFQRGICLTQAD